MALFFRIVLALTLFFLINSLSPLSQAQAVSPSTTINHGEKSVNDYRIKIVSQPAKGWYMPESGKLTWMPPAANTNIHLEVFLINSLDKRPLPNAGVTLSIYDTNNKPVETKQMIMLWSPDGYHYGNNFTIPASGKYTVKVTVTYPMFARHNKKLGNRFFEDANVTFPNVALKPLGRVSD